MSAGLSGCQYMPHEGFLNDCPEAGLPESLAGHELVGATWEGIDTRQAWDCHCHLFGAGDSDSGAWVNPDMQSLLHPMQLIRFKFYLNASCAQSSNEASLDEGMVQRLLDIHVDMPEGFRYMLLGFDYHHGHDGSVQQQHSAFHTPDDYALKIKKAYPEQFEWIASIHPYRQDAVDALQHAVDNHARAIKWLPSVMGIDAGSPKCDAFYEALARHNLPLLTHVGSEYALATPAGQDYNNPLLFRRALDHGVRVIFAHCATLGESKDLDRGRHGPMTANLDLFARLMAEPRYNELALGDIAAITQVNRDRWKIERIIESEDWHDRLIYGSDYPLPGVMPLYSPQNFVAWGMLSASEAKTLSEIRRYNPILFDVMLKRRIQVKGKRLKVSVFESRRHFV